MVLYYYSGKDAKTGKSVYIRCEIIENCEHYVVAKSLNTGHVFKDQHKYFTMVLTDTSDCIVY